MPKRYRTQISREELERGIIPVNHVLVEMTNTSAEGLTTKAGVVVGFLEDDTFADSNDSHTANLAQVHGKVYRTPEKLYFNPDDENGMPWDCDMELRKGDEVWFDIIEAKNSVGLVCEDRLYISIPYPSIYCGKRNNNVIMLNGYVLLSPIHIKNKSPLAITKEGDWDKTRGIVAFVGIPNRRYIRDGYTDIKFLNVGDTVLLDSKTPMYFLERKSYLSTFSEDNLFWVVQCRRIVMVLE